MARVRKLLGAILLAAFGRRLYRVLASGALTIDLGAGRRTRALGQVRWQIAADRETVFEYVARGRSNNRHFQP